MAQEGFEESLVLPLGRMVYGEVGHSYVALARHQGACLTGKLGNTLKFTVKEIDPSTGQSPALVHDRRQACACVHTEAQWVIP